MAMAKANSPVETPGMSRKASQPKSTGKQTTLFGFFSKAPSATSASTPSQKRVEARSLPLTPLASSEIGEEETPIKLVTRRNGKGSNGLRTPVTPDVEKTGNEMDVDSATGSVGSRKVCLERGTC
jgi:hypothetical protein